MSTYLITGTTSGLGESMARKLCQAKHTVYGVARRAEKLAAFSEMFPDYFRAFPGDVCDAARAREICEQLPNLPDIAILNAGIGEFDAPDGPSTEQHRRIFDTNYFGVLNFVEPLFKAMAARGHGKLVVISSLGAFRALPRAGVYGASKAALTSAIESMRLTYGKKGVEFVLVHPGFVATPMNKGAKDKLPFILETDHAAREILDGVHQGKLTINFPLPIRLAMTVAQLVPPGLYRRLIK
ncbi:MAG: SDR family NAD(P)-dependent oxidoreductase [Candidatus Lernaella stagnicola]|nr:SDR family NAD(P)-dependent oxidoreductase [Candidatus Lernaella stagnicola]